MKSLPVFVLVLSIAGCNSKVAPPAPAAKPASATPDAEGFVPIDIAVGKSVAKTDKDKAALLEGFDIQSSAETGAVSFRMYGDHRGYVYTNRPYRNFTLRLDVRWPMATAMPEEKRSDANTGVLVFITGEHKIWPKCLEVQGKWSELCHIKSNAKDVAVEVRDDQSAREKARKPAGEWNSLEIVAKDGALTSTLNGEKIAESDPTALREGSIGFQAERYDVEFRNVRIREE